MLLLQNKECASGQKSYKPHSGWARPDGDGNYYTLHFESLIPLRVYTSTYLIIPPQHLIVGNQ